MTKNVLVLGKDSRAQALQWKLGQSPQVDIAYLAPGDDNKRTSFPIDAEYPANFPKVAQFCRDFSVSLVVVSPETILSKGIVDYMTSEGISCFGPTQEASLIESDKFFSYDVMLSAGINQAQGIKCYSKKELLEKIHTFSAPVVKARGLTGGKGVFVYDSVDDAIARIDADSKIFGDQVLLSERMYGEEFSVFAICDGEEAHLIPISFQDHKRAFNGDKGPNTGGMGAYGPTPIANVAMLEKIKATVLDPAVKQMKTQGTPFKGFLYAGMMLTQSGPRVIEYNARFGDPECQPAMMLIEGDMYEALKTYSTEPLTFSDKFATGVVLASRGYPADPKLNYELELPQTPEGIKVFFGHRENGRIMAGRAATVTAKGDTLEMSIAKAYNYIDSIDNGNITYRTDVGAKGLRHG